MKFLVTTTALSASMVLVALGSASALLAQDKPAAAPTAAESAAPAAVRSTGKWNLSGDSHLAISGFDPVSYFPEGGGKPKKGDSKFTAEYRGASYRFTSDANKKLFLADSSKFEPSHGGWCSWAMREGDRVDVDPESFIVKDGRLFLFYNGWLGDTRSKWIKGSHAAELRDADAQWLKYSGEKPAAPAATVKPTASEVKPAAPDAKPADGASKPAEGSPKPLASGESARPGPLGAKLDAIKEKYERSASPAALAKSSGASKEIASTGVLASALKVGATAPDFELTDATGKKQALKEMLAAGPVVVTFYRGSWCPFCTTQLSAYEEMMPEIKALGAQVVAVSPELPENSKEMAQSRNLSYTLLSDSANTVAKQFGVSYALPESMAASYKPMLAKANGNNSGELPLAATYVIDRGGRIAYAYIDADYRKRAEPSEVLAALKSLKN